MENIHESASPLQLLADCFTWCRESHARLIAPKVFAGLVRRVVLGQVWAV